MSRHTQQVADFEKLPTFTRKLATSQTAIHRLSPVEERLLAIAKTFFIDSVICVRANQVEATGEPIDRVPVTAEIAASGARLALAAAVEIEASLRAIRERVEVRR